MKYVVCCLRSALPVETFLSRVDAEVWVRMIHQQWGQPIYSIHEVRQ